jgi:hypothetical protein
VNYCVMVISTSTVIYEGTCLEIAADFLRPGTCYGKGNDMQSALDDAQKSRRFILCNSSRDSARTAAAS